MKITDSEFKELMDNCNATISAYQTGHDKDRNRLTNLLNTLNEKLPSIEEYLQTKPKEIQNYFLFELTAVKEWIEDALRTRRAPRP